MANFLIHHGRGKSAKCQNCHQSIQNGEVRIEKRTGKGQFHCTCLFMWLDKVPGRPKLIQDLSDIAGINDVTDDEKRTVLILLQNLNRSKDEPLAGPSTQNLPLNNPGPSTAASTVSWFTVSSTVITANIPPAATATTSPDSATPASDSGFAASVPAISAASDSSSPAVSVPATPVNTPAIASAITAVASASSVSAAIEALASASTSIFLPRFGDGPIIVSSDDDDDEYNYDDYDDDDDFDNNIVVQPSVAAVPPPSQPTTSQHQHQQQQLQQQQTSSQKSASGPRTGEECSVCLDPPVHPVSLPCAHSYCYLCAKGLVFTDRYAVPLCSLCRRPFPRDYLDSARVLQSAAEDLNDTPPVEDITDLSSWQWFYQGNKGWWKFEERNNEEIEENFGSGVPRFETMIVGKLYTIDFQTMDQYQTSYPTRKRRIKRDLRNSECKGVAGLQKRRWNQAFSSN